MEGGAQDNASFSYMKSRTPNWQHESGGDNFLSKFARNGVKTAYFESNGSGMHYNSNFQFQGGSEIDRMDFGSANTSYNRILEPVEDYYDAWFGNNMRRPIYFDPRNEAYIGVFRAWHQAIGNNGWNEVFNTVPHPTPKMQNGLDWQLCKVLDFILPEKAGFANLAYMAYQGQGDEPDHDPSGPTKPHSKLFVSNNIDKSTQPWTVTSWKNITPSTVGWNQINDIEIDPENPARIWIALGSVKYNDRNTPPAQMTSRILYSSDNGTTWIDVSSGLPPLPANKILYQQGSNDVLYLGTDAGVFRCDFSTYNSSATDANNINRSVTWTCFNNSMPTCVIEDMEFNYCAGKLRIATFGRGMWECDVLNASANTSFDPAIGDVTPNTNTTITSNTTWSSDQYLTTSVRVKSGATLTISGSGTTIHMPKNGVIVVEPNAKLIVNAATITNDCSGLWGGIEAWGTASKPQTSGSQGTVLLNGATLSNARNAIANWAATSGDLTKAGGIIQATSSHFLNNRRTVEFVSYHNTAANGTVRVNNLSYFTTCDFKIDNNYRGDNFGYDFSCHASLWEVEGVRFNGCSFINTRSTTKGKGQGNGITSFNAGYSVVSYCPSGTICGSPTHSTFDGFYNGIDIGGDVAGVAQVNVDLADFSNVTNGIHVVAADNLSATRNTFNVGNGTNITNYSCYENTGIYTFNTHKFRIEENIYKGTGASIPMTGERIEQSGMENKQLYMNTYSALTYGVRAVGANRIIPPQIGFPTAPSGLQILCGRFDHNRTDIFIDASKANNEGIAPIQGSYNAAAGNTFASSTNPNIINNGLPVSYYYDAGNAPVFSANGTLLATTYHATCTSNFGTGTDQVPNKTFISTQRQLVKSQPSDLLTATTQYVNKMDHGSTAGLIETVSGYGRGQETQLTNLLMGYAPYVSEAVMRTVADKGLLPQGNMVQVLAAMPEALRSDDFLYHLQYEVSLPLAPGDISYLRNVSTTITDVSSLQGKIADVGLSLDNAANYLVTGLRMDSVTVISPDTLSSILAPLNEPSADYTAAASYYSAGNYTAGDKIFNKIPTKYKLSADQTLVYQSYQSVFGVLNGALKQGRGIRQLTATEIGQLNTIAGTDWYNSSNTGKAIAGTIPVVIGNPTIPPVYPCYNRTRIANNTNKPIGDDANSTVAILDIYPNPATSTVNIRYDLSAEHMPLQLTITNSVGQVIWGQQINEAGGLVTWNAQAVAPGVYFCNVTNQNKKLVAKGKIVIIK